MTQTKPNTGTAVDPFKEYVKGLEGIIGAETTASKVDGPNAQLYYRGIPVGVLAKNSSYEETAFLLLNGHLPKKAELDDFKKKIASLRVLPAEILKLLTAIPATSHPMTALRTIVSAMGTVDTEADTYDPSKTKDQLLKLVAVMPTIIAAFYRLREGKQPIAPDTKLSQAADFLYMMQGTVPLPEMEKALDAYLILLADHGLNASTFSARVTMSTQTDVYSAIAAAIGTLKGDLHGSANQRAMEMLLEIGSPEKAESYVLDALANKRKIMGFGHRVYKKEDPRAQAFRQIAADMCEKSHNSVWMDISNKVEQVMMEKKQIPCNVDFFSASVLYILGFPVDFFTTVFAASRIAGWSTHILEQQSDNRLIRPKCLYAGPLDQPYTPMDQR